MEKFKMALLAVACLYMAGLNLWLEFKDWFNKKYQKREKDKPPNQQSTYQNSKKPSFVGESKTKFQRNEEIENKAFHSEKLEKEETIDLEKESVSLPSLPVDRVDVEMQGEQSITVDEFSLLSKSLSGQRVSSEEEINIKQVLQKARGTDLFSQFVNQVKGAEGIVNSILQNAESKNYSDDVESSKFEYDRYIRK